MSDERVRAPGAAFLLSQVGGHSSRRWNQRLAAIGLDAREVMLFRFVALNEGRSQRDVAAAIGLPASRIVQLVDRLERDGWVERRPSARDRRTNALFVTPKGREILGLVMSVSMEHEAELTRGLTGPERDAMIQALQKVALTQGLIEGVHPGFADPAADQAADAPDGVTAATGPGPVAGLGAD